MSEPLPPGWKWATVNEVSHVVLGQSPPGSSYNDVGRGSPFFQGKAEFGSLYPEVRKWTTDPKKQAAAGSVLVSVRAPVGPTNIAPFDCAIGRGLAALHPLGGIGTEYLLWAMRHTGNALAKQGTGSTFDAVTGAQLKTHCLPISPLAEQVRIVNAIEKHFSRIDAVESAARTALAKLDTLRRTVLTAAFSGRLVKPLNPRRGPDGLPEDWQCLSVGDVSDVQLGRQRSPNNHYGPHMHPYLRAANITWNGIDLNDVKEMNFDPSEANNFELCAGDILLNEASGSPNEVGKPAIWRGEIEPCYFQNTLLRVRTRGPLIHYLYWHFHFLARLGKFGEAGRGVNIRHLGKQGLVNFPIIIAPLHEQKRIVATIDEHFSRIDAAKSSLERCLQRCSTLRRAVLAAAFSGRLVEQDPNDEPASVLLERIAVEQPKRRTPRKSA